MSSWDDGPNVSNSQLVLISDFFEGYGMIRLSLLWCAVSMSLSASAIGEQPEGSTTKAAATPVSPRELAVFESLGGKTPEEAIAEVHRRFEEAAQTKPELFQNDPILAASSDPERLIEIRLTNYFGAIHLLDRVERDIAELKSNDREIPSMLSEHQRDAKKAIAKGERFIARMFPTAQDSPKKVAALRNAMSAVAKPEDHDRAATLKLLFSVAIADNDLKQSEIRVIANYSTKHRIPKRLWDESLSDAKSKLGNDRTNVRRQ